MLQGLTLIDVLSSSCWEKKEKEIKKEKRSGQGLFSQGQTLDTPCWLCQVRFLQMSDVIKRLI
jgi:hypothetical protein